MEKKLLIIIIFLTNMHLSGLSQSLYIPINGLGESSNSNIGVGTPNPRQPFEIARGTNYNFDILRLSESANRTTRYLDLGSSGINLVRQETSNAGFDIRTDVASGSWGSTGGYIRFLPRGVEALRIQGDGSVKINTGLFGSMSANLSLRTEDSIRMTILSSNGNIGVGTLNPRQPFEIARGTDYNFNILRLSESANRTTRYMDLGSSGIKLVRQEASNAGFDIRTEVASGSWGSTGGFIRFLPKGVEVLRISSNGYVGIGTTTPSFELDVKGTIRAEEIKVSLEGADFVFEDDYKLMPLKDLESFIRLNKHLPEIPSATEMQENGSSLGELSIKLLQKIEELMLYAIKQNQEIELLKQKLEKLEIYLE